MTNLVSKVESFGKYRSYGVIEIAHLSLLLEKAFAIRKFPRFFCCWLGFHNTADRSAKAVLAAKNCACACIRVMSACCDWGSIKVAVRLFVNTQTW